MRRYGLIALSGLLLFGISASAHGEDKAAAPSDAAKAEAAKPSAAAQPEKSTAEADDKLDFKQQLERWQNALADFAQVQTNLRLTVPTQREALAQQFSGTALRAKALAQKLQAVAEKDYVAGDKNPELGKFLFTIAVSNLRNDNYEESLRVAKLLIDHKYPDHDIYRVAATAAFATMQLDEAEKYLAALGDGKKVPDEGDLKLLEGGIEHYRPLWQQEEKLRKAESKADDLPKVKLQTSQGDIVLELFENEAPNTVANFISLVEKGFYDGTQFHRVLPGFMAQGGDPLSKDPVKNKELIGKGTPGYTIADEFAAPKHRNHFRGTLSMAHSAMPDSAGSQFFITFAPAPNLDGSYTAFGRVIEGLDVLSRLQRINPDKEREQPSGVAPDKIVKAEVLRKRSHPYEPKTMSPK
jgi:cyclophilin family peptidyl-prolyl cis-trans isomerase